jgi:DNA-binding Xre family transcriptional regulator
LDTYAKIEKLMADRHISAYRLSKDTGISTGLLSQWKKRIINQEGRCTISRADSIENYN